MSRMSRPAVLPTPGYRKLGTAVSPAGSLATPAVWYTAPPSETLTIPPYGAPPRLTPPERNHRNVRAALSGRAGSGGRQASPCAAALPSLSTVARDYRLNAAGPGSTMWRTNSAVRLGLRRAEYRPRIEASGREAHVVANEEAVWERRVQYIERRERPTQLMGPVRGVDANGPRRLCRTPPSHPSLRDPAC
jgi:hypothetical protein